MPNTVYLEGLSSDPYVIKLHRSAIRVLNDPSLQRWQRERHIRRIQSLLLTHLAKLESRQARRTAKQASRQTGAAGQHKTRRMELSAPPGAPPVALTLAPTATRKTPAVSANDASALRRNRPILTLRRA